MGEETELQRGEVTFQGPTVRTCRAKFRIQVSWIPGKHRGMICWGQHTFLSEPVSREDTADLRVRGGGVGMGFPPVLSLGI